MARQRRRKPRESLSLPPRYTHQVESLLLAVRSATAGIQEINIALLEQQGPEWSSQRERINAAKRQIEEAHRWLAESCESY